MKLINFNEIKDYKEVLFEVVVCGMVGSKRIASYVKDNYTILQKNHLNIFLDKIIEENEKNKKDIEVINNELKTFLNRNIYDYLYYDMKIENISKNIVYDDFAYSILKHASKSMKYNIRNRYEIPFHVFGVGYNGLLGSLYDICEHLSCGMRICAKNIPFGGSSIMLADELRINPYRLDSDMLIILCNNARAMCEILNTHTDYVESIGYITRNNNKIVIDKYLEEKTTNREKLGNLSELDAQRAYEFVNNVIEDENKKLD